jgi:hypothetical protein
MRFLKAAVFALVFVFLLVPHSIQAQTPGQVQAQAPAAFPKLRGNVMDPTGGLMPSVDIAVVKGASVVKALKTDALGAFSFDLAAGDYQIAVTAPDFKVYTQAVKVAGGMRPLAITMSLEGITSMVEVKESEVREVVVDAASSLDATTLTKEQIEALPDDEESLLAYLQLLAGGEGNAQILIDGFEGGRLPRRDQIAQIIVEPNSFNANGTGPKITIVTRSPGAQKWTGGVQFQYRDSTLNARTPGSDSRPQMRRTVVSPSYNGPVIKGKWTMSIDLSREQYENGGNALRAVTLNGPVNGSFVSPRSYGNVGINNQLFINQKHTAQVQIRYNQDNGKNQGIGGFTLPERASDQTNSTWNVRVGDNLTISPKMISVFNLQVNHSKNTNRPLTNARSINVIEAFNGGGSQNFSDTHGTNWNLNEQIRWTPTPKLQVQVTFNGNYQYNYNYAENNFLGTFTFSSLDDYKNGHPRLYTQSYGNPLSETHHADANTSIQGTYRLSPNSSGTLGVAYTLQNHFRDYNNFSPVANYQLQIKKKTTIQIGARMNHPNVGFNIGTYEQIRRQDGTTQQYNISISEPSYPDPFSSGTVTTSTVGGNSLARRGPHLESPYQFNTQISLNQQLPKNWRFNVNFNFNKNVHQLRTRNVNAPYPGTSLTGLSQSQIDQLKPFYPYVGRITQYESVGNQQNRNVNIQVQIPSTKKYFKTQIGGNFRYTLTWAWDDNGFENPYNMRADWARNDQRHQIQGQFQVAPPKVGSFNFNFNAASGRAYNITTGKDGNFDQSFNDRPAGVKRNSERGPGGYTLNLNWNSRPFFLKKQKKAPVVTPPTGAAGTPAANPIDQLMQTALAQGLPAQMIQQLISQIASQPGGIEAFIGQNAGRLGELNPNAGAQRQPSLRDPQFTFSVSAQNVLNHTRVNAYSGVLTSPFFGKPTSWNQGRMLTISLNTRF